MQRNFSFWTDEDKYLSQNLKNICKLYMFNLILHWPVNTLSLSYIISVAGFCMYKMSLTFCW